MDDSELPPGVQYEPVILTPKQFEIEVEKILIKLGSDRLAAFKTERLETLHGADGEYEIDITARFEALGGNFLVLVECKHHKSPIKRDVVQVLYDRIRAAGAQKGMLFATTRFQKGAGTTIYPPGLPAYVGWLITLNEEGNELHSLVDEGIGQIQWGSDQDK
jgi:hypothetical protein